MKRLQNFWDAVLSIRFIHAIRDAFMRLVPVFLIGAIALMFAEIPIAAYQTFLDTFLAGGIRMFLTIVNRVTMGSVAIYVALAVSHAYAGGEGLTDAIKTPAMLTSIICFLIGCGYSVGADVFNYDSFGVKGVFLAIVSAIFSTWLFQNLYQQGKKRRFHYVPVSETRFYEGLRVTPYILLTSGIVACLSVLITLLSGADSIYDFMVGLVTMVFSSMGESVWTVFLMMLINSILWFFGVHGSNVLEPVTDNIFTPLIYENMEAFSAGQPIPHILSKTFIDVFILMGGCGVTISLLLSILFFSRRKSARKLAAMAALPMFFNINEIMVFGYPIIFNPYMFIPFVLAPIICLFTSYLVFFLQIVPPIVHEVNWTTPIFLGGYIATDSVSGAVLQLVNLLICILLYRPFIRAYDKNSEREVTNLYQDLVNILKDSEEHVRPVVLTELSDVHGAMARNLLEELRMGFKNGELELYYQPQYNRDGECMGMEALLRWNHKELGMIYPPLVIALAAEGGIDLELETYVLNKAIADSREIREQTGFSHDVSVNVSGNLIQTKAYVDKLLEAKNRNLFTPGEICLEVTEQKMLVDEDEAEATLDDIRDMGYMLAMDDFSMGHTSLKYLMDSHFDIVKLDGSLVGALETDQKYRAADVIKSIAALSESMNFSIVAEYVETPGQVKQLYDLGCNIYQGWLFSKAIPKDELIARLNSEKAKSS